MENINNSKQQSAKPGCCIGMPSKGDIIAEIKEKINTNHRYLSPMNREFRDDIEKYRFSTGYEYTCFLQQNGVMNNPTKVNLHNKERWIKNTGCKNRRDYENKCVQNSGYKDCNDRQRKYRYNNRTDMPMSDNDECSSYFGIHIAENYIAKTFEDPVMMPINNRWYDWICKKGQKIEHKAACLRKKGTGFGWPFSHINFNRIADYFVFSAWDNRDNLIPMHIWIFYREDIVRGYKFWNRQNIWISNNIIGLKEFENFEVTDKLEKLKKIIGECKT